MPPELLQPRISDQSARVHVCGYIYMCVGVRVFAHCDGIRLLVGQQHNKTTRKKAKTETEFFSKKFSVSSECGV